MSTEMQQQLARVRAAFIKVRDFDGWENDAEFQAFINKAVSGVDELDKMLAQLPPAEDLATTSRIKDELRAENQELRDENARLAALVDAGADGVEIETLRAQLAEVTRELDAARYVSDSVLKDSDEKLAEERQQLLATQAHAARMVEALKAAEYGDWHFDHRGDGQCYCPECGEKKGCAHSQNCIIGKALSTPINLDALNEALARECERLAAGLLNDNAIEWLQKEAADHRAKKSGEPSTMERAIASSIVVTTEQVAAGKDACTCPSGDGSLSWPCQQHPPEQSGIKLSISVIAPANPYTDQRQRQGWERGFAGRQPFNYPPDVDYMAAYRKGQLDRAEHQKKKAGL